MQKLIAFFFLLGLASSTYALGLGGIVGGAIETVGGAIETAGAVAQGTAKTIGYGLKQLNPFEQEGYPIQQWATFGIHPIFGTGYCSCPAGFLRQGYPLQAGYGPGFAGTVQTSVQQVASAIPNAFNQAVKETKQVVSNSYHGY